MVRRFASPLCFVSSLSRLFPAAAATALRRSPLFTSSTYCCSVCLGTIPSFVMYSVLGPLFLFLISLRESLESYERAVTSLASHFPPTHPSSSFGAVWRRIGQLPHAEGCVSARDEKELSLRWLETSAEKMSCGGVRVFRQCRRRGRRWGGNRRGRRVRGIIIMCRRGKTAEC